MINHMANDVSQNVLMRDLVDLGLVRLEARGYGFVVLDCATNEVMIDVQYVNFWWTIQSRQRPEDELQRAGFDGMGPARPAVIHVMTALHNLYQTYIFPAEPRQKG